jgi:hypothetical protein
MDTLQLDSCDLSAIVITSPYTARTLQPPSYWVNVLIIVPEKFGLSSNASDLYCHVFQWLRRRFGLVNRFIGSSLVVTTISSYTPKITVTIAHVTSHTKCYNFWPHWCSLGTSEFNSYSRILSYPLGTDHAQKIKFYCCAAQTTKKTSHVITISPAHWLADCWVVTSYKYSSYCWVTLSEKMFVLPLQDNIVEVPSSNLGRDMSYSEFCLFLWGGTYAPVRSLLQVP